MRVETNAGQGALRDCQVSFRTLGYQHACAEDRVKSRVSPCGQVLPQKCQRPAALRLLYRACASRASVYSASVRRRSGFWNISVTPGGAARNMFRV